MANINDPNTFALQLANDIEELNNLRIRKSRRWLIHNQNIRSEGKRFCDLDHLLLGDCQITNHCIGIQIQIEVRKDFLGTTCHFYIVDQTKPLTWFATNENVLGSCEIVHQVQFLMDDTDPEILGGLWPVRFCINTVDFDCASVFFIDAGQHFHQRRFTSAILTHQGVNFAFSQFELDIIEGSYTRKAFFDALHFDNNRHCLLPELDGRNKQTQCGKFIWKIRSANAPYPPIRTSPRTVLPSSRELLRNSKGGPPPTSNSAIEPFR